MFSGTAILALIAAILALVGIINASKDEGAFKSALVCIIVSFCTAIIAGIFSQNSTVMGICRIYCCMMKSFF